MDKKTIARALGILTDVRQTMTSVKHADGVFAYMPWIDTFDQALGMIKNELTVEEAHTYARRNA